MSQGIVNHPWGRSQDWTSDAKGYSPSHWLSGVPKVLNEYPNHEFNDHGYTGQYGQIGQPDSEGYDTSGSDESLPAQATQPYAPAPVYGAPTANQGSASQPPIDQSRPMDYQRIIYTGAIMLMGIGSVAVAIIQYKMYIDNKEKMRREEFRYNR